MAELLVLGGGPAGVAAARTAAAMGATVSLVERAALGGVCVHAGCIPAGALHRTAEVLDQVSGAGTVGVAASPAAVDWTRMLSWVGSVVTRGASLPPASSCVVHCTLILSWVGSVGTRAASLTRASLEAAGVEVLSGSARFTAAGR